MGIREGALALVAAALGVPGALAAAPVVDRATVDGVLEDLALDDTQGRDNLSPGSALARARLVDWLVALDVDPAGEGGTFEQVFPQGTNLLAIYHPPGTDGHPPAALIGAHYDHVGTRCAVRAEAASSWCNGAADNAGGAAAALAAFESLIGEVNAPVALALWDAEEDGKVGSEYFAAHPSFDPSTLRLYVNFDIVGLNLFRGGEDLHFVLGAETGGPQLLADVDAASVAVGADMGRLSYVFGYGRSDMDSFVEAGYPLPFVFLTDGDGSVYHTTADELAFLNVDKVEASANMAARLAWRAAQGGGYLWIAPTKENMIPTYHDAEVVLDALRILQRGARANELTTEQRQKVAWHVARLGIIVARDPQRFGIDEGAQVVGAAFDMLDLSAHLPFVP